MNAVAIKRDVQEGLNPSDLFYFLFTLLLSTPIYMYYAILRYPSVI